MDRLSRYEKLHPRPLGHETWPVKLRLPTLAPSGWRSARGLGDTPAASPCASQRNTAHTQGHTANFQRSIGSKSNCGTEGERPAWAVR